ncbi:MAG: VWA domain-containing protein [Lachnospiraceae bacterium]|nr:VWA domain-containing protein [Lachnospiraceae bacterium]
MTQEKRDKRQILNDALNEIDGDLIEEAANIRKTKKVHWAPLAAAAVLLITAAVVLPGALTNQRSSAREDAVSSTAVTERGEAALPEGEKNGHESVASLEPEVPAPSPASDPKSPDSSYSDYISAELEMPGTDRKDTMAHLSGKSESIVVSGEPVIDPGIEPESPSGKEPDVPDPGQLTAGAWNDNDHFPLWRTLFQKAEQGATAGKFADYADAPNAWFGQLSNRITVTVVNGGDKVSGRKVWLRDTDGSGIVSAVTDANGVAYLFCEKADTYRIEVESNSPETHWTGSTDENTFVYDLTHLQEWAGEDTSSLKDNVIELMYVIDATGSMGDELSYVKSELSDVVKKVVEANPGVTVRVSFLTYRDDEDEEKFHYEDFTDVSDEAGMKAILHELSLQDAMGGGDYEEAVDEALEIAMSKNWSAHSTKLIFHVLDAPAHDEESKRVRYENAVKAAAEKGIRLCPVLASGSDQMTEYLARSEALLTGGTFVFVTDDSGIGFGHHDPQLPDAVHEHLNALMVRLINGYHTGTFADPVAWNAE